ncbi:MAG: hypothetical protein ACRD2B_05025 [Terriglobia bacterium]
MSLDRHRIPFLSILILLVVLPAVDWVQAAPKPQQLNTVEVVRGTLTSIPGKGPALKTTSREYVLAGQSSYLLHTLEDKRLLSHELQLVGTAGPDGTFTVQKLYDVHNGKLYHVQYYCEVCNITYVQPGHCYCCGRETKLREVPVSQANP